MRDGIRVQVVGSSADLERVEVAIESLRMLNVRVQYDWPAVVREVGTANPPGDTGLQAGIVCWEAVLASDLVWALVAPSFGAGVEVGIAFATGIPVIMSGDHPSVFRGLATAGSFKTDVEALTEIMRMM